MKRLLPCFVMLCGTFLYGQSGDALLNRGNAHYDGDRSDSARHYYGRALAIDTPDVRLRAYTSLIKLAINETDYAAADSLAVIADALLNRSVSPASRRRYERMKANGMSRDGRYREALRLLERVAAEQARVEDPAAAESLMDIALTYKRMQLPDSALLYADRAHRYYREVADTNAIAFGYFYDQLGAVYYGASRLPEAKHFYERGIEVLRRHGETTSERMGLLYNNLANVYADEGRFAETFALREKALDLSKKLGARENYAIGLFNLGVNHYMVGNFGAASQYVAQSIRIREELLGQNHPALANSYQARSILQSLSGDDRGAIASYRQLIDRAREALGTDTEIVAGYFDEIGLSYFNLGQLDSAIYYHRRAIETFRANSRGGTEGLAIGRYNLAAALAAAGHYPEALAQIESSRALLGRLGYEDGELYGRVLASYAMRLAENGQSGAASERIMEALTTIRRAGEYKLGTTAPDVLRLLTDAAFMLYDADPSGENLARFRRLEADFVETAERTRMQFYDPYTKGLLNDRAGPFLRQTISRYFALYAQTGHPEFLDRIYALSEYGKATAIRDRLRTGVGRFSGVPDSVPASLANLQQRMESLYFELEDTPAGRRDSLDRELFRARRAYDSLNLRVATDYPDYYALFGGREFGAGTQVQAIAPNPGESYLIYLLGTDGYYALVVSPDTLHAVFCGAPDEVDALIAEWRADIASVLTDHHRASGNRLYRMLWEPVAPYLAGGRVRVVPDGAIHSVAFDALSASATEDRYLLHDYTISYAYSLTLYARQSAERLPGDEGGILSVAPGFGVESNILQTVSQPFALGLAERMRDTYVGRALLGREATEANVRSATDEGSVLLFATHGTVDREMPLQSGIQLTDGDEGGTHDGFWSIAEIFNSRLSADLSILGICESGIGRLTPGEGMLSVAYAFTYAGCASTANTLWPVDDRANAELTEGFLAQLAGGKNRAAALRAAKREYLGGVGPDLRHPYYWGALVIQGRDGPVDIRRKGKWKWWAVAIGISAVLAFAFTPSPARRRPRADNGPYFVE